MIIWDYMYVVCIYFLSSELDKIKGVFRRRDVARRPAGEVPHRGLVREVQVERLLVEGGRAIEKGRAPARAAPSRSAQGGGPS